MRICIVLWLCLAVSSVSAQVVNTEKLRLSENSNALTGDLNLNIALSQTKSGQVLNIQGNGRLQYIYKRSKWSFLTGYAYRNFSKVQVLDSSSVVFNHYQFGHLRYGYEVNKRVQWEAFLQEQFDDVHEIDIRYLAGTGPRLQIAHNDSFQLYTGAIYMYEHEENSPDGNKVVLNDHRLSTYISAGFSVKDYLTVNHISYFQPNLGNLNDFRILIETSVDIKVTTRFSLALRFDLIYDTEPPANIPRTRYNLSNGLSYRF